MFAEDLEGKLTPAAKQTLDELIGSYREQVLFEAQQSAARLTGEFREISVHDIMRAMTAISREERQPRPSGIDKALIVYSLTGVLVAAVGLLVFAFGYGVQSHRLSQQLPLIMGLTGVMIAVVSFILLWARRTRIIGRYAVSGPIPSDERVGIFLSRWSLFERHVRVAGATVLGESSSSAPLSLLIEKLADLRVLPTDGYEHLQQVFNERNAVVHGRRELSQKELADSIEVLDQAIAHLRRVSQE